MKTITTLTLSFVLTLVSHTLYAQSSANVAIKLGDDNQIHTIEKPANYKLSELEINKNPKLNIYSTEGAYTVTDYQLSILLPIGEVIGPFEIKGTDMYAAINQKRQKLSPGTRIFVENIKAECDDCTNNKKVVAAGLTILVQ